MNIEPALDPSHVESPICWSTWSCATACSFLRWWWILVGAYFHVHIFSWFVKTISALTLAHHYRSLKLLFVPPWTKKTFLNQLALKHCGACLCFTFFLATSPRSRGLRLINARRDRKSVATPPSSLKLSLVVLSAASCSQARCSLSLSKSVFSSWERSK